MSLIPNVNFNTQDGNTGAVQPATTGILAIIAAIAGLAANAPASFTKVTDIQAQSTTPGALGPGLEYSAYYLNNAKKPVVVVNPTCSTAGAYGTIDHSGVTGTATITGAGTPLDEYDVIVTIVTGGTLGTAGITYTYSLDGGNSVSAVNALGTGLTLSCPLYGGTLLGTSTGVSFTLATTGVGTLIAGDTWRVQTTRPQMTATDLLTALAALKAYAGNYDNVLVDGDATSTLVADVDSWLSSLEAGGVYKMAWMNTRHKNTPAPTAESESAYLTFLSTLLNTTSSIRLDVGADGGDLPSVVTGLVQVRPTSLAIATRANVLPVGVDPAYVALGPVPGFKITDSAGKPKWHNEDLLVGNPGIDALRLSTLRSVPQATGTFITNADVLSPNGSDFVYDQHVRAMNAAKNVAFPLLTQQLSKGYRKQPPDPTTGAIYILEDDAAGIEGYVNPEVRKTLLGQVNDVLLQLARNDDVSSNAGAKVHVDLQVQALAYGKEFDATARYVKSVIAVTVNN